MNGMLGQSLMLQWKASRFAVVPFVLAGFGLPLLAVRQAHASAARSPFGAAGTMIDSLQMWLPLFPITAALLGLTLGLGAWSWDHRSNHVYALSLPVTRWEYALLKLAAGVIVLLIPVAAVLAGVSLGVALIDVPAGLHAYPFAFTFRFLLAALIVFAAAFALAAGTVKTTTRVLSGLVLFLIFGSIAVGFVEQAFGIEDMWTPIEMLHAAFGRWPGPFHVFGGNWMPIDV